jgi:hypothetical protein
VVKVYSATNSGEYVLAVGDEERIGPGTLLTIGRTSDRIRARFLGRVRRLTACGLGFPGACLRG